MNKFWINLSNLHQLLQLWQAWESNGWLYNKKCQCITFNSGTAIFLAYCFLLRSIELTFQREDTPSPLLQNFGFDWKCTDSKYHGVGKGLKGHLARHFAQVHDLLFFNPSQADVYPMKEDCTIPPGSLFH